MTTIIHRPNMNPLTRKLQEALHQQQRGQFAAAEQSYHHAQRLAPGDPGPWQLLGKMRHQQGQLQSALPVLEKAVQLSSETPATLFDLGKLLSDLGQYPKACGCFQKILQRQADHLAARYHLGHTLYLSGQLEAAEETYQAALKYHPSQPGIYSALGIVLHRQERETEAISAMKMAVKLQPDYLDGHINLAEALRQQGHIDEAIASFRQAIALAPEMGSLWYKLADSKRFRPDDMNDVQAMETALKTPAVSKTDRMHLGFALGKAYDDMGQYEKAFPMFAMANAIKRATYPYDIAQSRHLFATIKACFSPEFFSQKNAFTSADHQDRPIFIVGMPRSGTTLVEQILSCHPDIDARGERHDLQEAINQAIGTNLSHDAYLAAARKLDPPRIRAMAKSYLEYMRPHQPGGKDRLLCNKLPFNFLYVGWIHLMFPKAIIIQCIRNPADTCLSIYQHLFPSLEEFAYTLPELGQYYQLYQDLMSHWAVTLPGRTLELHYEELVTHQEEQTRRLIAHCGLGWHNDCLNFHNRQRIVSTASFAQVRRPIYTHSLQRWKGYQNQLGTLLEQLGQTDRKTR